MQQAKPLGAQYMLTGSITKMGYEETTKGFGMGRLGLPGIGAVGKKHRKTRFSVTARVVDTSSGEIMFAVAEEGISNKGGGFTLGGGGLAGGLARGGGTGNVKEMATGEATEMAVHNLVIAMAERW